MRRPVDVHDERRDRLDRLIQTHPRAALDDARSWIGERPGDTFVEAFAWAAIGRALFELGETVAAADAMRRATDAVARTGSQPDVLSVSLSAAAVLAETGAVGDALAALGRLTPPADPASHGRLLTQFAYVLHHAGRLSEALEHADRAEPLLSDDDLGRLRLLLNRGLIELQQGRIVAAEHDFELADRLATRLDQTASRAMIAANLGVVYGRSRQLQASLEQFRRAAVWYRASGEPGRAVAIMEIDRAETLMHGGLLTDAVDAATSALRHAEATGNRVLIADSQLVLATVELTRGRSADATRLAAAAMREFAATGRPRMVTHAHAVEVQARLLDASDAAGALADAAATIDELVESGWDAVAHELRVARVRAAQQFGLLGDVADEIEALRLGAFSQQRHTALAGWFAEAVARFVADDPAAALDACRSGLDLLDDIVAEAPTLGHRSAAMRLGNDLSRFTIDMAVGLGDAGTVLAAAEGTRARALHEELSERHRHRPLTESGADRLRREVAARLGSRTLVEWVLSGDAVWAVVFDSSGSRLVEVGPTRMVRRQRDRVLVALDEAAIEPDGSSAAAVRAAQALDDLLISPLDLAPDTGVVVVPVGLLHGIPWSGLPSLAVRPFVVAPNAQLWLEADRRAVGPAESAGLVVGPDIDTGGIERPAVERLHPDLAVAAGAGATAATVASMFAGLDVVHVAAHGTFRSDHPLLSTFRLHDGEATLYDAVPERVGSRLVVLSSCEAGAQGTADGSEVLGLSAVLLARGAAAVLAPLTVVRDLECADFVTDVHTELAGGQTVACAVAEVRRRWLGDDDLSRWAVASSFACFGSGVVTVAAG